MNLSEASSCTNRCLLINFRIQAEALNAYLPGGLKPSTCQGWGRGEICFLSLKSSTAAWLPQWLNSGNLNISHRFYLDTEKGSDIYTIRRDTSSLLSLLGGYRLFTNTAKLANIDFHIEDNHICLKVISKDDKINIEYKGDISQSPPTSALFYKPKAAYQPMSN